MSLFDRTASKMAGRTVLLLPASPGDALLDAARPYDPAVRIWHDRLVFANGVLLHGPVAVTPKLEQQAGLPPGMAVAYYTGVAIASHRGRRAHDAVQADADLLVAALAGRFAGQAEWSGSPPDPDLAFSVWGETDVPAEQVLETVRPYDEGKLKVEDRTQYSYSISGAGGYLQLSYWSPEIFIASDAPAALGELPGQPLPHWDLTVGRPRAKVAPEVADRLRQATLALAGRSGGTVLDEYRFPLGG